MTRANPLRSTHSSVSCNVYDRSGDDLSERDLYLGLYLDMPTWGYHVFAVEALPADNFRKSEREKG